MKRAPLIPCLLLAACSLGAGASADVKAVPSSSKSPVGTNLAPISDWSTERPFGDLMKQSRAWISNTEEKWDDGRPLDVDARGNVRSLLPGQRARTLVMWGDENQIAAGDYVVTWKGGGALDFWPNQENTTVTDHRAAVHVDPKKGGLALTITAVDKKDPLRDIHVWKAGAENKEFADAFLEGLRGYSTLRFMDWMTTNDTVQKRFDERPVVDDVRWSEHGVPLEVMIDLCNAAHTDMWLAVPDTWDDDAVQKTAALVHTRLAKQLLLYVEDSNEVWNEMFPQAKRARTSGVAASLARDPFEAQLRQHAARSVAMFRPFEAAFAADRGRLVRVLGSMTPSPWASETMLSTKDAAAHTDAIAIAPYVGVTVQSAASVDAVFSALDRHLAEVTAQIKQHKAIADKYKVRLIAYEGGQHLVATGPARDDERPSALPALFLGANRDARMKDLYLRSLRAWKDAGGGLFMHYFDVGAPNKYGAWGARERLDDPRATSAKYDALMAFAEATPRWW